VFGTIIAAEVQALSGFELEDFQSLCRPSPIYYKPLGSDECVALPDFFSPADTDLIVQAVLLADRARSVGDYIFENADWARGRVSDDKTLTDHYYQAIKEDKCALYDALALYCHYNGLDYTTTRSFIERDAINNAPEPILACEDALRKTRSIIFDLLNVLEYEHPYHNGPIYLYDFDDNGHTVTPRQLYSELFW
jgi:hypothetical protein